MKRIDFTGLSILFFTILVVVGWLVCSGAYGENHIGITLNKVVDDVSGGVLGSYTYEQGAATLEIDGQLQATDLYRGNIDTALTFDVGRVGIKMQMKNDLRGPSLEELGRSSAIIGGLTVPVGNLNFDVGLGGMNAAPWAQQNAEKTLIGEGFDPAQVEGLGLDAIFPAATGLPFKDGSSLNVFVSTGFNFSGVDIDLEGIFEVAGEGDTLHQGHATASIGKALGGGFSVNLSGLLGLAAYREAIHYETGGILSLNRNF